MCVSRVFFLFFLSSSSSSCRCYREAREKKTGCETKKKKIKNTKVKNKNFKRTHHSRFVQNALPLMPCVGWRPIRTTSRSQQPVPVCCLSQFSSTSSCCSFLSEFRLTHTRVGFDSMCWPSSKYRYLIAINSNTTKQYRNVLRCE